MFSKAKRFEPLAPTKSQNQVAKPDVEKQKPSIVVQLPVSRNKQNVGPSKIKSDTQSQCSSQSTKSFATPKPIKPKIATVAPNSLKKPLSCSKIKYEPKTQEEIIKAQMVEIRNKDLTIIEYNKQIEELKDTLAALQKQIDKAKNNENAIKKLDTKLSQMSLYDGREVIQSAEQRLKFDIENNFVNESLVLKIYELEKICDKLEKEVGSKQLELSSLEEVITIRDSLCQDLQDKLSNVENCLEETKQRLEMVKGHHALALEANESIRREYKVELETLKSKMEDEKQAIINKGKSEQENIKSKYNKLIDSVEVQMSKEKYEEIHNLQQQLIVKDKEMKAKLDQINEATSEKLKLCEIQFEERTRNIQEHCAQQQSQIKYLEVEAKELKYQISVIQEENLNLQKQMTLLTTENESLKLEKVNLMKEINETKEGSQNKFENEINKLSLEVDKITKEKNKFETSLSVTRDIVQVLTMRLRDSDNELEHLEATVQTLKNSKEVLENELSSFKNTLNNTVMECNEYKDALVNILKSKAALAKEHNRIMEHNVTLIESLQNVEKEAYRELGTIKNELIEDVEVLKKESNSQIRSLREEVEKKRALCELATEQAAAGAAAAEQARLLLARAATELARADADNERYRQQIQDQQSLVVELSLLRQENEELTMTAAKQSSLIDKMKKDMEQVQNAPKSPSVARKPYKMGKENVQTVSPLRERNC